MFFFIYFSLQIQTARAARRRGFTLIEAMVAISVMTLAMVGPMALMAKVLSVAPHTERQALGYSLAREAIEYVKHLRDAEFQGLIDHLSNGGSADDYVGPFTTQIQPCLGAQCIADVFESTLQPCVGTCPPLRYSAQLNRYGYGAGGDWIDTALTRWIEVTDKGNERYDVSVHVRFTDRQGVREVQVKRQLFSFAQAAATRFAQTNGSGSPEGGVPPSQDYIPYDGLVHHWPFDGSGADLADSAPASLYNGAGYDAGVRGQALALDRSVYDREHAATTQVSFDPFSTSWSLSLWVYPTTYDTEGASERGPTIFAQRDLDSNPRHSRAWVYIDKTNHDLRTNHNGVLTRSSGYVIPLNAWTHVVLVHDKPNDTLTWFINGTQYNTHANASVDSVETGEFYFGALAGKTWGPSYVAKGKIDEVRLYDRVLTAQEILGIYNFEKP